MRWISVLAFLLLWIGVSRAAGPDDQYLDIYNEILQADNLQQNSHPKEATTKYLEAQKSLIELKEAHPTWNTEVVSFRLDYLADQLHALAKLIPAAPSPTPQAAAAPSAKPITEIAGLQEQIRLLNAANGALENKLKEALSIQPAAISPHELAKAEEKIVALQKEKDLLTVALEQAKAAKPSIAPSPEADKTAAQLADANQALASLKARSLEDAKSAQAEMAQLKSSLADAQKKITSDSVEMDALKAARASEASVGAITTERDKLKEDLAARIRDLADAEARRDQNVVELRTKETDMERQRDELRTKLADTERQKDELQAKLAAAPIPAPVAPPVTTDAQVDQLRARLAVLEAPAVPYTPEELAVFKKNPPQPLTQMPAAPVVTKHIVHSKKDLPPGTGALMDDATRAKMERDYPRAAEIYQDILRQDTNNVYVLANLAFVQFSMNKIADCEKTVLRTLALDPEDPASLNLLGIMRYRQEKLDDALSALSLSAKYNSTNASTQYYLGCVLTEKGLRPGAETAFRKALEADPNYADAHYGLAFVYAQEKPPSMALARWHYQRALDLGHSKSPELEKLLASAP